MKAARRTDDQSGFERAFVATSYLLGRRGRQLSAPLFRPRAETQMLASALGRPNRPQRAELLAAELAHVARELQDRGIV